MFNWIAKLFVSFDRQQAAADRAAKAMEDVADDLEAARDQLRGRLRGGDAQPVALPTLPEPAATDAEPASRNGRRRAGV